MPLATLLGRAERPGEIQGFGPVDPALGRTLAATVVTSPHTSLCVTVTSPEGYAIGHGCARAARRPGQSRGLRPSGRGPEQEPPPAAGPSATGRPATGLPATGPPAAGSLTDGLPARLNLTIPATALSGLARHAGPWALTSRGSPGPPGGYGTWILTVPGGRQFTVDLDPVPAFDCDHRHETTAYMPGARLRHLVQVRDGTCTFPSCNRQARESDFEHAQPYHQGGRTCACNAGARSRACHRVKQAPGWQVTQPRPGWHQWTTPSGRVYTQEPWRYPA